METIAHPVQRTTDMFQRYVATCIHRYIVFVIVVSWKGSNVTQLMGAIGNTAAMTMNTKKPQTENTVNIATKQFSNFPVGSVEGSTSFLNQDTKSINVLFL